MLVPGRKDKGFHFVYVLSFSKPEANGRWMRGFPVKGDTCLGSAKEMADNGFLIDCLRNSGGMEEEEGWIVWNRTLRKFLYDLMDHFPKVCEFGAGPEYVSTLSSNCKPPTYL